jgi:diguanylate cyclase (GGDEF)-like protein/PAS domain S-box-containing protein
LEFNVNEVDRTLLELTAILNNASVGILVSCNKVIQRCNRRIAEIFGYLTPEELIGKPGMTIFPDAASYERIGREAGALLEGGQSFHADWMFVKADGSPVWCNVYAKALNPVRTDEGTVWILEDITEAKQTREALGQTLREMEAIMQNAPVSVLFTRDRKIIRYNPKFAEMFRFGDAPILGVPARVLYRSDEEYSDLGRVAAPLLSTGKPFQQELYMRCQDGTDIWANLIGYVLNPDNTSEGTIWIVEDRSVYKQRTVELLVTLKQVSELAEHDPLTNVFNRRYFDAQLAVRLNEAQRYAMPVGLLLLDLDYLKRINDRLGHAAGDEAIKSFAAVIGGSIRQTDLLARIGGDEFAIFLPQANAVDAASLAGKLLVQLAKCPAEFNGEQIPLSASIGIAISSEQADTPERLLKRADVALYQAKQAGRACYRRER